MKHLHTDTRSAVLLKHLLNLLSQLSDCNKEVIAQKTTSLIFSNHIPSKTNDLGYVIT